MFGGTVRLNPLGLFVILTLLIIFFLSTNTNFLRSNENGVNLRKLLSDCVEIAENGGKKVVEIKKEADIGEISKGLTKEGIKDVVTKADYKSHCVMFYGLKQAYPTIKVISEEKSEDCTDISPLENVKKIEASFLRDEYVPADDVTVWIDPLDATKEYTEDLLQYVTTMVCVAVKGKPILGIIHKPFEKEPNTYWAWYGRGTSSNINYAPTNRMKKVIISRSHSGNTKNITQSAFGTDAIVEDAGGAGYKALEVATGNFDAYLHTTIIKKWDICAGNAVLNALHGQMTTLDNKLIDYSANSAYENTAGLLATVKNHDWFLKKLGYTIKQ